MLKKFVLSMGICLGLFFLIGFLLPRDFIIHRSILINVPRIQVHEAINNLEEWSHFMPWTDANNDVEFQFGEIRQGKGATKAWISDAGKGSFTITDASIDQGISCEISFGEREKPAVANFYYDDTPKGTMLQWSMRGRVEAPLGGYMTLLIDSMLGPVFEKGLVQLKDHLENEKVESSTSQGS